MIDQPISAVVKKCWRRALTLYLWGIGLTILFSLLALHFVNNTGLKPEYYSGNLPSFMYRTLTLRFSYGWGDFLNFYAAYLFFAPLAIFLLRKKLWHSVLMASLVVWLSTMTMMGGWQIVFFSGLVAGYHRPEIDKFIGSLSLDLRRLVTRVVYLLTAVTLVASVFFTTIAEEYGRAGSGNVLFGINLESSRNYAVEVLRPIFNRGSMEPARLVLFFLWFSALYILVNRFEEQIKRWTGWLLITLGQNSLYVYIVHAILLFFLNLLIPIGQFWMYNVLINTGFVLLVWYMTKKRFLFKLIPR
jgi:hypothetical protein